MTLRRSLVVMVKEPRPGRVKTRLAAGIGTVSATWWFRHQVTRLTRRLRDPRWRLVLAVAPDGAVQSRAFASDLPRIAQGGGDLGDRMARAMRAMPPGPVCVIGADVPEIMPSHIWQAFGSLGDAEAVFGPSHDGGYWLVGVRNAGAVPGGLFAGVRWSTEHALNDSVGTLGQRRVAYVATLRDVDVAADLDEGGNP